MARGKRTASQREEDENDGFLMNYKERECFPSLELGRRYGDPFCLEATFDDEEVIARPLTGGKKPAQQRETNGYVTNYVTEIKIGEKPYLLYPKHEGTLEWFLASGKALKKEGKVWVLSQIGMIVLSRVFSAFRCCHRQWMTHENITENVLVTKFEYKHLLEYSILLTNDFKLHDPRNRDRRVFEANKRENWISLGKMLYKSLVAPFGGALHCEVESLIEALTDEGTDFVHSARFKEGMALHSPILWTDEYRKEFIKWALPSFKQGKIAGYSPPYVRGPNNRGWVSMVEGAGVRAHTPKARKNTPNSPQVLKYGNSDEELVRFVRNLTEHPSDYDYVLKDQDPITFTKSKFPQLYVKLVQNAIRSGVEIKF